MAQAESTSSETNSFSAVTKQIEDYISQFGEGDWNESIKYYTPEDWRSWGNEYPSEGMGAIAVMSYGGIWCDVMNGEVVEIRDNFLNWIKSQGWSYEIQNETTLTIYYEAIATEPVTFLSMARDKFQTTSKEFAKDPSHDKLEGLHDDAISLIHEAEQTAARKIHGL